MARIFITGSSDGIGLIAARNLIKDGNEVYLHARNEQRANAARDGAPGSKGVLVADLSTIAGMKHLASEANKTGAFDTVIHNAGLGFTLPHKLTEDGIATVFAVNSLAPYVLTSLMKPPKRLIYTSSGLHAGGDGSLKDVAWTSGRSWNGYQAYSDSKLHDVMLAFAVARRWENVDSNAVDPGWVKTKMGGAGAPGTTEAGADTLSWLAKEASDAGSGKLYKNRRVSRPHPAAEEQTAQEQFLDICQKLTGVPFPD